MEIPDGWSKSKICDVAIIDVGRDLIEDRFSRDRNEQYCFPVYSNTVEQYGHYGFYDTPEYKTNSVTVVARGIGLGRAFARTEPFGAIGRLLVLSPLDSAFDVNFLADYLNSNFRIFYESGGIPQLPGKTLGSYPVILPPLPEQRHIAEILGTWDRSIAATEALITASEAQKKALMQQLLTGKRRLPGFEGAWRKMKFKELLDIAIGGTPSRKNPLYWDDRKITENRWVSIRDLKGKYISDTKEYLSHDGVKNSNVKLVPRGSVIMSFKLTIGKAAILKKSCYTNEAIAALIPKNPEQLDRDYFFQALELVNFDAEIDQAIKGKTLNKAKLARLTMEVPDLREQQAIALVLGKSDDTVEALQTKLQILKTEKAALMQQLLTGKRRVKLTEAAA